LKASKKGRSEAARGGSARAKGLRLAGTSKVRRRLQRKPQPAPANPTRKAALKAKPRRKPSKVSRAYTRPTLAKLYLLSRNQCAYPDCPQPIIISGDKKSDAAIIGQICHIYAVSDRGPRGKPRLTTKQRNAFENLILMCRDHHGQVDTQYKSYPAKTLIQWKRDHEAKATQGTPQALKEEARIERHAFFEELSDEQIDDQLRKIRQARFLAGFDAVAQAQILARHVREARLSGGSSQARAAALAWCSRLLAHGDTMGLAKDLLRESLVMAQSAEAQIASAFITGRTNLPKAMAALAAMKSPESRSAALMLQAIKGGSKKALNWAQAAGLSIDDFCAEGKYTLVAHTLAEHDWERARKLVSQLHDSDFTQCPALQFLAALSHLLCAVPDEVKPIAFVQVPFEADNFPLKSRPEELAELDAAKVLFERVAKFAYSVGATRSGNAASDYAVWLGLHDQRSRVAAMTQLRDSFVDPATSIRRLNLAIRFGMKPDLAVVEERLERSVQLSGKATPDEAYALFTLALTKKDPRVAAEYIAQHRAELFENLDKARVASAEIQILVGAGLFDTAHKRLKEAIRKRYLGAERKQLERLIADGAGADVIRQRREAYDAASDLGNLVNLMSALEAARLWEDLLPYAQQMFNLSPSANSLHRVVHCLNELGRHAELFTQMSAHSSLVEQSEALKTMWAWALFREGRLLESAAALERLVDRNDTNGKALTVNLAITSGNWQELLSFCQKVWDERESHSAGDLMHAAQLSIALDGVHSRGLMEAALQKEPANPGLFAKAYFEATSAGWDRSPEVSGWLKRAAQLSTSDGPIQSMTLREILERKPKWDEQVANTWSDLAKGKLPTVAAGQIIHRSLVDLYLLPSLANPAEADVRRRAIIYAYSGARRVANFAQPGTLALDFASLVTFSRLGLLGKLLTLYPLVIPHATLGWLFQERKKASFHQPSRIKDARAIKDLIATEALGVVRPPPSRDENLRNQVGADLSALLSEAREKSSSERQILVVRSAPLHRLSADFKEEADIAGYEKNICSCSSVIDRFVAKGLLTRPEEEKARDYLNLTERRWPDEPVINDLTEVYLDDVSVAYFHAMGVLDKFKAAGLKAYITQTEDSEANGLLALERLEDQQLKYIEDIRSVLASGIQTGRVRLGRINNETPSDDFGALHPTYTALGLATISDALVIDDRGLNHIQALNDAGRVTPLLCSLDVLDLMRDAGALSQAEVFEHRTTLRRAGYQLMPLYYEELEYHLQGACITNGDFIETAELRAIRESLLRVRMGAIVQLPAEMDVLNRILAALVRSILHTWERVSDPGEAQVRSDYLLGMADPRNWAPSADESSEKTFAHAVYGAFAFQLLRPPASANAVTRTAYFEWVTSRVVERIRNYMPDVYKWLMGECRAWAIVQAEALVRAYEAKQ
jgi:hypothetical protein